MGIVISKAERLTRTTLRIRVGKRTDMHVRWQTALPSPGAMNIGQMIFVNIPEGAVHLEAGGFRCGKQRLNRWIGRVMLVNRKNQDLVTTVKLYRENITFKSVGPVKGVVDPQQTELVPVSRPRLSVRPSSEFSSKGRTTHN